MDERNTGSFHLTGAGQSGGVSGSEDEHLCASCDKTGAKPLCTAGAECVAMSNSAANEGDAAYWVAEARRWRLRFLELRYPGVTRGVVESPFKAWPPGAALLQVAVAPHAAAGPYPTAMRPATPGEVEAFRRPLVAQAANIVRFDVLYEIAATFSLDYNEVCKVAASVAELAADATVMTNGLTRAETEATASVRGLVTERSAEPTRAGAERHTRNEPDPESGIRISPGSSIPVERGMV